MYEQSFNYLAKLLTSHLRDMSPGLRVFLQLEKQEYIASLASALRPRFGQSFDCGNYETCALLGQESKVVLISTDRATEHYITRIRNCVASQEGKFHGTSLLILDHTGLDSITGGCRSLTNDGEPLHTEALRDTIQQGITDSRLTTNAKIALRTQLEKLSASVHEDISSIFSFVPFMDVLNAEKLTPRHWNTLSLFADPELEAVPENKVAERIKDNERLFLQVHDVHQYGNPATDFESDFSSTGCSSLGKERWGDSTYGQVVGWEEAKKSRKPPVFEDYERSLDGHVVWIRNEGDTKAASRKQHVVIFNENNDNSLRIDFRFDSALRAAEVNQPKKNRLVANVSGKLLSVNCDDLAGDCVIERVRYDDSDSSARFVFNIAILPFSARMLHEHRASYRVDGSTKRRLEFFDDGQLAFNCVEALPEERLELTQAGDNFELAKDHKTIISTNTVATDDSTMFTLTFEGTTIPAALYRDCVRPKRISGTAIWKRKREEQRNFDYPGENKVIWGNDEYFTNLVRTARYLDYERTIVQESSKDLFWRTNAGAPLEPEHISVPDTVRSTYLELAAYYQRNKLLPSLAYISPELKERMVAFVQACKTVLDSAEPGKKCDEAVSNILRVGAIQEAGGEQRIFFTPLHPLNVQYQLSLHAYAGTDEIPEEILGTLSPAKLLPYFNDWRSPERKMTPIRATELPEWLAYKPHDTLSRGWHNEYVEKLIAAKIAKYVSHFPYLFTGATCAPVRVNLINMGDCADALRGILLYFKELLAKHKGATAQILPLEVRLYGKHSHGNKFEAFARYTKPAQIERDFQLKLEAGDLDASDVLNLLHQKVRFYMLPDDAPQEYAHLSFFRFDQGGIDWTYRKMAGVKTGLALDGLVNSVPSQFEGDEYFTGFGTRDFPEKPGDLMAFAKSLNPLALVAFTSDPFRADHAMFSTLKASQKQQLDAIYERSNWVTLIDPQVDLNFFKDHETSSDLTIIHYSDQYNSSSGYDAITVTRKSHQYQAVFGKMLTQRQLTASPEQLRHVISMFNAVNGDWLLNLIDSQRAHFSREKITVLSAAMTMLAVLRHPDITWLPLSLEEVLRVSGGIGLSQREGIFSAKNLGAKNETTCDDLLMAGIEMRGTQVHVHLLPVEVKVGKNTTTIIEKAKKQARHTAQILRDYLPPAPETFKDHFYRNFFAKMILTATDKMQLYGVDDGQDWLRVSEARAALLSDDFQVSWEIESCFANSVVVSFREEAIQRKARSEDGILIFDLFEDDGYQNLLMKVDEIRELYLSPTSEMDLTMMLSEALTCHDDNTESEPESEALLTTISNPNVEQVPDHQAAPQSTVAGAGMKILFGHDCKFGDPVYWHPNDTDKVMHTNTGIIGTMGTGKTQFTKALVTQLVREREQNVNGTKLGFLIFDYKGDYIKEDFLQATGARRLDLYHLPYNPLALTVSDKPQPMLPLHTGNAIRESIATAFNLGTVQRQKLRDVIMQAYTLKGIDKGNPATWKQPAPTLADVWRLYLDADDVKQDSLYAAVDNLNEFEIFQPDSSKTVPLWDLLDGAVVINLSGYSQDIQNLVVAITLDQFYNQMQRAGHSVIQGNLRELCKMILVDEADNFLSQGFDAVRRILKEGREFGVGTILSTQFLSHFSASDNEYANYILTWVVHRVTDISMKSVPLVFGSQEKAVAQDLVSKGAALEKHISLINAGMGAPAMVHDHAFWQLLEQGASHNAEQR